MQYLVNNSLYNFKFWGGAKQIADLLSYKELLVLEEYLEELSIEKPLTETEINDFIWFDDEFWVVELLGYKDIETFYKERIK